MKKPKSKRATKAHTKEYIEEHIEEDIEDDMEESSAATLRATFLEAVDNQLRDLDPPETKQTYDRLVSQGFSDQHARNLIAALISREVFDVMKHKQPYNTTRYVEDLARLPKLPWE